MPASKKSTKRQTSTQTKKALSPKSAKRAASESPRTRKAQSPLSGRRAAPRGPAASAAPRSRSYGVRESSKLGTVVAMLRQKGGTTIDAMCKATGWQSHSVRGALSGAIGKRLGLNVQSIKTDGVRTYRIAD